MLRRRRSRLIYGILFLVLSLAIGWWVIDGPPLRVTTDTESIVPRNALVLAKENYFDEVKRAAEAYDLPYEYLMALTVLECSGRKPAGSRFEKAVYKRLNQVKSGDRKKYENVRKHHLEDAEDGAVRNLSTSWGPFQLMGYKCIGMEVNVRDIRGEDAVIQGARWIKEEYGHLLKKKKYKDAFHYHNTGRKYPKFGPPRTHDPKYVEKGLKYIEYFTELE